MTTYTITESQRQQLLESLTYCEAFNSSIERQKLESLTLLRSLTPNSGEPVAYITETTQGPMVWTPEMYGEACTYCDDGEFPVPLFKETCLQTQYPLPDSLYPGSKDWVQGDYAQRVEWLHSMYESQKEQTEMYVQMATHPAPSTKPAELPGGECFKTGDICAKCGHGEFIAAPSTKPAEPDMFWNADDSEKMHQSIGEFLNDEICNGFMEVGAIFTIQQAKRLPDVLIKITSIDDDECDAEYEVVAATTQGETK